MAIAAELEEWVDETATTALYVHVRGKTITQIDRPHATSGWYGIDGQAHAGTIEEGAIGLPFEPTPDGRMRQDVASVQKSVIAVMVGIALDRGLLEFDDPVSKYLGAGWTRAGDGHERAVTVRHLLSMTSGLDNALESEGAPGEQWRYGLGPAWHILKPLLVCATGSSLDELTEEWILIPLGMDETTWISRPGMAYLDGTPFEALFTTARDLIRFGEMVLDGGVSPDGHKVISTAVLSQLLQPSQAHNPAYGLLWWLNGQRSHLVPLAIEPIDDVLYPAAPLDMVLASGAMGQVCQVIPSREAVIVRLGGPVPGVFDPGGAAVVRDFWRVFGKNEAIFEGD